MRMLLRGFLASLLVSDALSQIVVTTGSDSGDAGLSLREAIESAASGETIMFTPSFSSLMVEISQGEILVEKNLIIEGLGTGEVIAINGGELSRLFHVSEDAHLTLRYLDLSGGVALSGYGGGILNEGTLTLEDCRISQCRANSGGAIFNDGVLNSVRTRFENNRVDSPVFLDLGGGAILSNGTATLTQCNFVGNLASGVVFGGGAVYSRKAHLTVFECAFRDNRSEGTGGGVMNSGILEITDSTFEDNFSLDDGAAVFNAANLDDDPVKVTARSSTFSFNKSDSDSGALHLSRNSEALIENCTITENIAQDAGGAIENSQGKLTISACTIANNRGLRGGGIFNLGETSLKNSVLSGNSTSFGSNDLQLFNLASAKYTPVGANIIEEPGNSRISTNADPDDGPDVILPGPALLLPLGNYGGASRTMPPQVDSPALNAAIGSTLNTDQRGSTRFVDSFPDIGSVEFLGVFNEPLLDSDSDGLPNGIEVVTGTDPVVKDLEHSNHLRIGMIDGVPTLSFGYIRSTSARYILRVFRSSDLNEEVELLSSLTTFIPNSREFPFQFPDDLTEEDRAFYRLEVTRR